MDRMFVIIEAWHDHLGIKIPESELRARLDVIIALRVNKGGEHWNWEKAIEILTEGVKSDPPKKR